MITQETITQETITQETITRWATTAAEVVSTRCKYSPGELLGVATESIAESIQMYQPGRTPIERYAITRAIWHLRDQIRADRRTRTRFSPVDPGGESILSTGPLEKQVLGMDGMAEIDLVDAIEALGPPLAEIIRMRWEGYTQPEIATELGISQQSVSRIIWKNETLIRRKIKGG